MFTALSVVPTGVHSPGYFTSLRIHVWSGVVLLALFFPGVLFHLARNPDGRAIPALLATAGVTAAVASSLLVLDGPDDVGAYEIATLLALASMATTAVLVASLALEKSARGGAVTGALLVVTLAAALISGYVVWTLRGDSRAPVQHAHSVLGLLSIALLVPHLRWARRWIGKDELRARTVALLTGPDGRRFPVHRLATVEGAVSWGG